MTDKFFENVASLIEQARTHVGRTADLTMCVTYFEVGRMIVEQEQDGEARAKYGKKLLAELSKYLNSRFRKGFSQTNLKNARKFYQVYSPAIRQLITDELKLPKNDNKKGIIPENQIRQLSTAESNKFAYWRNIFKVSWTHYCVLMRIEDEQARQFYEIETLKQQWNVEYLKRQHASSLYERLAMSRNKDEIMRLANEGLTVEKPQDIIKNPLSLEFLGLDDNSDYSENDLEIAVINKLQKFMLEMGKGFLFEARQKRFTFDEQSFFVDLILYNRLLQCYVIVDFKITALKHQDLGQMQMYVNYFDRYVKTEHEKPTIGILLCREKSDSIVELTLPTDSNIYATAYSLYLPDKKLLQAKLAEWVQEFEDTKVILEIENNAAVEE
ncbi:MAG: PDDEXK nuclease domain-containing protein [Oscillospiraceae bacterium]|nr:PDDEXK nuclease domain-containing protein [Oscillospiraceae bacterium]